MTRSHRRRRIGVQPISSNINEVPRLECKHCERVLNGAFRKVEPGCQYTKSFARLVINLRQLMTILDVSRYFGVSETMIRGIDKKYLQKKFDKPRPRDLKVLGINRDGFTY